MWVARQCSGSPWLPLPQQYLPQLHHCFASSHLIRCPHRKPLWLQHLHQCPHSFLHIKHKTHSGSTLPDHWELTSHLLPRHTTHELLQQAYCVMKSLKQMYIPASISNIPDPHIQFPQVKMGNKEKKVQSVPIMLSPKLTGHIPKASKLVSTAKIQPEKKKPVSHSCSHTHKF